MLTFFQTKLILLGLYKTQDSGKTISYFSTELINTLKDVLCNSRFYLPNIKKIHPKNAASPK